MSNKREALGGTASDKVYGAFPYTIACLERENRALKRQLERLEADLKSEKGKKEIYSLLIDAMDEIYADTQGEQKEWVNSNWKSILLQMIEVGEGMITDWNAND